MTASGKKARQSKYTGEIKLDNARMEKIEKRATIPKLDLRPYMDDLKRSFESGESVGYDVYAESVNVLKSRFRQAAGRLNYGVSFQIVEPGSEVAVERGYHLADGDVRFLVTAGEKQVRTKPGESSAPGAGGTAEGSSAAPSVTPEPALVPA